MQMDQRIQFLTDERGARLAYSRIGAGSPIVRTAPWLSHLDLEWQVTAIRSFYEAIAQRHSVIRYDSQGCGLSDWTRAEFTLAFEVALLERLVDKLNLERFAIFGYGAGGPIAIAYAAQHPERVSNLVLFGTSASPEHLDAGRDVPQVLKALMVDRWELASRLIADLHAPQADGMTLQAIAAMYRQASTGANVSELAVNLEVPTTVIHRLHDSTCPYRAGRELAARLRHGCLVPLSGSAHLPYLGETAPVLAAIAQALGDEVIQDLQPGANSNPSGSCAAQPNARAGVILAQENVNYPAQSSGRDSQDQFYEGSDADLSGPDGLGFKVAEDDAAAEMTETRAIFRCEGEYWTLAYAGDTLRIKDSRGMRYIAQLLRYPGREFHASELEMRSESSAVTSFAARPQVRMSEDELSDAGLHSDNPADAGEMLDPRAKGAYRRRLHELRAFLEEAKALGNVERALELEEEISFLTRELSRAVGLGGRDRRAASVAQRSRINVTRAIRRSIEKIRQHHPALGAHLTTRVKTGLQCVYRDRTHNMQWDL